MERGALVGGRFEIDRLAGAGGMGTVYRAFDRENDGRVVALKMVTQQTPDDLRRFAREAQMLAAIEHESIVRYVADGPTGDGGMYLAMEWLDGEDLAARFARQRLSPDDALALVGRIAHALGAAHSRGLVHRDIKPSNVFLVDKNLERVKLLDFGVARNARDTTQLTQTGAMIGTPAYMAPEQARGDHDIDARADVFALGCLLFESRCGQPPFVAEHPFVIVSRLLMEDAPRLADVCPGISPELDALVARMLSRERSGRPADGAAVALEIASFGELDEHSPRAVAPVRPLSPREQRISSVLVATLAGQSAPSPEEMARIRAQIEAVATPLGVRVAVAASGTLVAVGESDSARSADVAGRLAAMARALQSAQALASIDRIAIATGRTVVTGGAVAGDAIERALVMIGPSSEVLSSERVVQVDRATADLLDPRFEIGQTGSGLTLSRERDSSDAERRVLGRRAPCVGRDRELGAIEGALTESIADSVSRIVVIVADAGAGKSRLLEELVRRTKRGDDPPTLLRTHGEALRAGSPFATLGPGIRRLMGMDEVASPDAIASWVSSTISAERSHQIAPFLGEIVGTPFPDDANESLRAARRDPVLMADATRAAWLEVIASLLDRRPVLLTIEDAHWADPPSIKLVAAAATAFADHALMVVATGRPEIQKRFPALFADRATLRIDLSPLGRNAAEKLTRNLLGAEATPEIVARIVELAHGSPLYVEELVRAEAAGATGRSEGLLGAVQARLATLSSRSRLALRAASIFGGSFWLRGVGSIVGDEGALDSTRRALDDACLAEIIVRSKRSRLAGEEQFDFRHALVRDAAYDLSTDLDRNAAHGRALDWLESAGETDPLVLAHHADSCGLSERAVPYHLRAAQAALAADDLPGAIERAERGIANAKKGELAGALRMVLADAAYYRGDIALAARSALEASEMLSEGSVAWLRSLGAVITACGQQGDNDAVERVTERVAAVEPAEDASDDRIIALTRGITQLSTAGRRSAADAFMTRLDLESPRGPLASAWIARVQVLQAARANRADLAIVHLQTAIVAYERLEDVRNVAFLRILAATCHLQLGEYERAEELLSVGRAAARRIGATYLEGWAQFASAKVFAWRGDLDAAKRAFEDVAARMRGSARIVAVSRVYLSWCAHQAGDATMAEQEAQTALAIDLPATHPVRAAAHAVLARAWMAQGRHAEAERSAREAARVLEAVESIEELETMVRVAIAEVLHRSGAEADAKEALNVAYDRVLRLANAIDDPTRRDTFLTRVPENARTIALAHAWSRR